MKKNLMKSLFVAAMMLVALATPSFAQFQNFENKTHTPEAQPFADLSQKIWDLMAQKDATSLKDIFHPNDMFVHMGGYWGTEQELNTIGQGFIFYKQADVYGVDVKQINEDNWAVYSTIVLTAEFIEHVGYLCSGGRQYQRSLRVVEGKHIAIDRCTRLCST